MTEFLNDSEKAVLGYICYLYKEKYSVTLNVQETNCCKTANIKSDVLDNIMRGLCVRGYFYSPNFKTTTNICTKSIELTEKALNYFNAEQTTEA